MNKVRWGIVGTGNIANKFATALKNVDNADLVAVASRNEETALKFSEKFDIPFYFGSYEELASFKEVDIVYIATPHTLHYPCTEIFLNSKKSVLCEKPIAVNVKEFNKMVECAKTNNVFLMEALWTRFLPALSELKKMVFDGIIGDLRGLSADFCYDLSNNREHNVFDVKYAGGSLLDVGIYTLNFAFVFLGSDFKEIKTISSVAEGVDEHINILMSYPNGAVARLSSALTVKKPTDAYIYGSKGYIYIPHFYCIDEFEVFINNESSKKYKFNYIGNGFEEEIIECNSCILQGKKQSDIMPLDESYKILKLMDLIREREKIIYPSDCI